MLAAQIDGTANRRAVEAAGLTQHFNGAAVGFESGIELFRLFRRAAPVVFALYQQRWRGAAVGVGDRGALGVNVGDFVRMAAHLLDTEPDANIATPVEADPVGDGVLGYGGFKAIGLPNNPAGQIAAA